MTRGCSYIFLDEAGNFDFSANGTRHFVLTAVTARRSFHWRDALDDFKYDCIEDGVRIEYFHCYNDSKRIRSAVFDLIASTSTGVSIDCLVVDKSKVPPAMRGEARFYPSVLGHLLSLVVPIELKSGDSEEIVVITDTIPVNRRRRAVEKAVQTTLVSMLPSGVKYRILHHQSRSHYGLQVADYCCWAIFRKWEREDITWFDRIRSIVRNEFESSDVGNV